ncbi:MAG: hypothetical protein K6U74_00535 [Firmicutes bacterium]|nr:hypothetical protein [Bacillota bacterium]
MTDFAKAVAERLRLDRMVHGRRSKKDMAIDAMVHVSRLLSDALDGKVSREEVVQAAAPLMEMYTVLEYEDSQIAFNF